MSRWHREPGLGETAAAISLLAGEVGHAASRLAPQLLTHTREVLRCQRRTTLETLPKDWHFEPLFLVPKVRGHLHHRIRNNTLEPLSKTAACPCPGHLLTAGRPSTSHSR